MPSNGDVSSSVDHVFSGEHLRFGLAVLAACGLAVSVYLAAFQLGVLRAPWDPIFGARSSAAVLQSSLSRRLPVPDAALGALGYLAELVMGLAGGPRRWLTRPWLVLGYAVLAWVMGAVGATLILAQAVLVRHGCALCLCSAVISITIALGVFATQELHAAWGLVQARRSAGGG